MKQLDAKKVFADASECWDGGRLQEAFRLFLRLARAGDASAQVNLAQFYAEGLVAARDLPASNYWLRRAFRRGASHAATNLGLNYLTQGKVALGESWLKRAAQAGDSEAWIELSRMYLFVKADAQSALQAASRALSEDGITKHSHEIAAAIVHLSTPATNAKRSK